jgi:hypothetical protein
MKNPVGRPTKYNEALQAEADRYIYEWKEIGDKVPSRVGLCCFLGIDKGTSREWEQIYPEFSTTIKAIETLQERTALNGGLAGDFNPTITKLVLANHGYHESQSIRHTSPDGSMTPQKIIIEDAGVRSADSSTTED